MSQPNYRGPMPVEERAKRFLASYSKHGGKARAKSFRKLGEIEQIKIAQQVLGETIKADAHSGHYYLTCPGVQFHSCKSGRKDCRFTPGDGGMSKLTATPSLHCVHQSCGTVIEEMNRKIRSECGKHSVEYITDHGSKLNNAAAALIIGFDLKQVIAHELLVEWGKTCTPIHTALACGAAIVAAQAGAEKKPDEVGYLLNKAKLASVAPASSSPRSPSVDLKTSFASAHDLGDLPDCEESEVIEGPIYLGVRGKIAKEVRVQIEIFRGSYGYDPTTILLGPDQPDCGASLCGLPIESMRTRGISVHG